MILEDNLSYLNQECISEALTKFGVLWEFLHISLEAILITYSKLHVLGKLDNRNTTL